MFHLTVKSGLEKGASWPIAARPLRIGRERSCDVRIPQTVVSRQHCELAIINNLVHIKHLGGINPTFVNGLPVVECTLQGGDEIRVGTATFLLTVVGANASKLEEPAPAVSDTLAEEESVYLSTAPDRKASEVHPKTDTDLADLFRFSRIFSRVTTREELLRALGEAVRTRFNPDHAWLMLIGASDGGQTFVDLLSPDAPNAATLSAYHRERLSSALSGRRGLLASDPSAPRAKSQSKQVMAAPLFLGDHEIGAIFLDQLRTTRTFYRGDLHFLVALMNVVAPFFRAIEHIQQLETENRNLRQAGQEVKQIIGSSKAIAQVQRTLRAVAPSAQPVLILGATGTGKEMVAALIHSLSERATGPLVTVNCAAIARELFESEFFGHEKGSFTGATGKKTGLLEESNEGTLFLDEIGDLSLEHQARILRAIETGRFRRVGGQTEISADFRVVAATNKDLVVEIKEGRFREDLYHRLRAVEIRIPPLSQRRCDIPELAQHFFENASKKTANPAAGLSPQAIEYLVGLPWPGNIRELKNVVEVACTLCRGKRIEAEDLRSIAGAHDIQDTQPLPLSEIERMHIIKMLEHTQGNILEAARLLGVSRSTLYNKITEHHIQR